MYLQTVLLSTLKRDSINPKDLGETVVTFVAWSSLDRVESSSASAPILGEVRVIVKSYCHAQPRLDMVIIVQSPAYRVIE